jgi:hypothetical protein
MPKKAVKKTAKAKKIVKKAAVEKPIAEKPIEQKVEVQTAEITQEAVVQTEHVQVQEVPKEAVVETKEEIKMTDEKGVGKDYNPAEFSQPAVQASSGSSKIFLYVGISVVVVGLIVAGLFFGGVFKGTSSETLTGATVVTAYCTDTDGGYNRFTKGVAEGTYYLDYSEGTFMDECASGEENKLTEYYCKNDLVVYATEPCPQGMTCVEGICK